MKYTVTVTAPHRNDVHVEWNYHAMVRRRYTALLRYAEDGYTLSEESTLDHKVLTGPNGETCTITTTQEEVIPFDGGYNAGYNAGWRYVGQSCNPAVHGQEYYEGYVYGYRQGRERYEMYLAGTYQPKDATTGI